jgi:hypothetical protein
MNRFRTVLAGVTLGVGLALGVQPTVLAEEGAGTAQQRAPKNPNRAGGSITAISGTTISVTRKNGATIEIVVSETTTFSRNGQSASLADFRVGDKVKANGSYDANGRFVAEGLTGGEKSAKARLSASRDPGRNAWGKITAVDASAGTLTVSRRDGSAVTVVVTSNTQLERNGQQAVLGDFVAGDRVLAEGAPDANGRFVADRLVSGDKAAMGKKGKQPQQ